MQWNRSTLVANDIELALHRTGPRGAPVLVLAHGFSDDGPSWSAFAERVVDRFELIAVDARNHGRSGRGRVDAATLSADLMAVVRSLGEPTPVLIGHSIGASTVAQVAASWPDFAGRIVLEDPPWRLSAAVDDELERHRTAAVGWIASFADLTLDELIELGRRQHPAWTDGEIVPWARAKRRLDERAVDHLQPFDWVTVVSQITCPTLVVLGEPERDAIATPELADRIVGLMANATIGRVAGAGHNIRRENLDGYLDVVVPFVDEWAATMTWPDDAPQ